MNKPATKDELIKDLVKAHKRSDKEALTQDEYNEIGEYNSWQHISKFGSWTEAKKTAGVPRVKPGREKQVTGEQIIEDIKRVAEGPQIKQDEYLDKGNHAIQTLYDRLGSWKNAVEKADLETGAKKISDKELREELSKGKKLGEIAEEYDYSNIHSLSQRLSESDIEVKNKFSKPSDPENNSVILSLKEQDLEDAGFDTDQELYYTKNVKDGKIELEISEDRVE